MTQVEAYPYYGSQEEKDLFLQRWVNLYNLGGGGIGGGGTGDVRVDEPTGRVLDRNDNLLGYIHRFLHVRFLQER